MCIARFTGNAYCVGTHTERYFGKYLFNSEFRKRGNKMKNDRARTNLSRKSTFQRTPPQWYFSRNFVISFVNVVDRIERLI